MAAERRRRTPLDAWRLPVHARARQRLGVGRLAGAPSRARGLRDAGLAPADVDAFVEPARGRARRRDRAPLSHVLPPRAAGARARAILRVGPARADAGSCSASAIRSSPRAPSRTRPAQSDRIELELVADAGHFVVDEKPELDRRPGPTPARISRYRLSGPGNTTRMITRGKSALLVSARCCALARSWMRRVADPPAVPPFGCLKSNNNYANLTARNLGLTLKDASCSGAETEDMTSPQNVDPDGPNPPQFDSLTKHDPHRHRPDRRERHRLLRASRATARTRQATRARRARTATCTTAATRSRSGSRPRRRRWPP